MLRWSYRPLPVLRWRRAALATGIGASPSNCSDACKAPRSALRTTWLSFETRTGVASAFASWRLQIRSIW